MRIVACIVAPLCFAFGFIRSFWQALRNWREGRRQWRETRYKRKAAARRMVIHHLRDNRPELWRWLDHQRFKIPAIGKHWEN